MVLATDRRTGGSGNDGDQPRGNDGTGLARRRISFLQNEAKMGIGMAIAQAVRHQDHAAEMQGVGGTIWLKKRSQNEPILNPWASHCGAGRNRLKIAGIGLNQTKSGYSYPGRKVGGPKVGKRQQKVILRAEFMI